MATFYASSPKRKVSERSDSMKFLSNFINRILEVPKPFTIQLLDVDPNTVKALPVEGGYFDTTPVLSMLRHPLLAKLNKDFGAAVRDDLHKHWAKGHLSRCLVSGFVGLLLVDPYGHFDRQVARGLGLHIVQQVAAHMETDGVLASIAISSSEMPIEDLVLKTAQGNKRDFDGVVRHRLTEGVNLKKALRYYYLLHPARIPKPCTAPRLPLILSPVLGCANVLSTKSNRTYVRPQTKQM